ncbi:lysophospholipid acyltransferase family protein [Rugosimonospora acidiphila]|uniref:Lysophospholipid acyltransferase family protein n=1 Tax=Rugosimonospora acidiphila TaxID=556531 RepID=A0ABP9SGS1_9ACTN
MRPPPRWLRRVLLAPVVMGLALVLVGTAPVWVVLTLAGSPLVPGFLRPLRLLWLTTVYLLVELVALVVMLALWLASGFGWRVRGPLFQRAHYRLCGRAMRVLYRQARWVLRLHVRIEGSAPDSVPPGRPLLVLSRHAGPGDSFLLAHALINWYDRDPRIVLKDALQWDPSIDVLLNRLPNRFIAPGREPAERAESEIASLAAGLGRHDALLIFPEGGNFTPRRWERAIQRLSALGLQQMATRARRMHNVLPPHPGGVLAALDAAPDADVIMVGHTGVDHLLTVADVWRALPMDKTIIMQWWLVPRAEVPAGDEARIEWLYRWWARIDMWIESHRPAVPTGAEPAAPGAGRAGLRRRRAPQPPPGE